MAVFISLTTDAFASTFNAVQSQVSPTGRAGVSNARRPLRGLEIKDDTYAIFKVVQSNGTEIPLWDSGAVGGKSTQNSNFILQSVQEARMEKHQIVETFGDPYIFFFGESPRFLDVTAVLIDSLDFNWYAEFWQNYDQYLRGSKSVEMGARTYLFYDDNIVEGYMLMAQARKTSDQPLQVQLTFRMFLTNYQNISFVGDDSYPIRANVSIPPSVETEIDLPPDQSGGFGTGIGISAGISLGAGIGLSAGIGIGVGTSAQALGLQIEAEANAQVLALVAAEQAVLALAGGGVGLSLNLGIGIGVPPLLGTAVDQSIVIPVRTLPLRSLISDNTDEFTDPPPPAPGADDGTETPDLATTAIQQVSLYGGNINSPTAFAGMGLGVNFGIGVGVGIGIGVGGGAYVGASFGVSAGVGLPSYGGINGGLGFTGGFGFGVSGTLGIGASPLVSTQLAVGGIAIGTAQYGNGVQLSGGIIAGTGVAGGIPGGLAFGIGPDGPGTLGQFTGGTSFAAQQAISAGWGANLSGFGACVTVGGAPSAFAMSVSAGTLVTTPADDVSFYTSADGSDSYSNDTGYTI